MISPLAIPAEQFGRSMFTGRRQRDKPLYGVMLHTTGSGLPKKVAKTPEATLRAGVNIYTRSGGPHYVIGWDGRIVATVADERIRGAHAGIESSSSRSAYQSGNWKHLVSKPGVQLWERRWPGKGGPIDLIPTRDLNDINDFWIGIEMIPVTPGGGVFWAQPAFNGARFTRAQHESARALTHDIARRHGFPSGWADKNLTRLVGHSDINPIDRDSAVLPLWDPGYHAGQFDMEMVRSGGMGMLINAGIAIAIGLLAAKYIFK